MFKTHILKLIPNKVFASSKRFVSEIAVQFLCLRFGKIGFIDEILTLYRMNNKGSYSGVKNIKQVEMQINARSQALMICSSAARLVL